MLTAYSILLGEHVDAREVVHADTAGFQIVCPCCRESVLKVERQGGGGSASHFFSHRQRSGEMAAECERRVAGISAEQRRASDAAARGQSLAVFQAGLKGALALQDPRYRGLEAKRHHVILKNSFALGHLRSLFRSQHRERMVTMPAEGIGAGLLKEVEATGVSLATGFAAHIQSRIAQDMSLYLATDEGEGLYEIVMRQGLIALAHNADMLVRLSHTHVNAEALSDAEDMVSVVDAIWEKDRRKAIAKLKAVAGAKTIGGEPLLGRFVGQLNAMMLLELQMVPYAEMLENHRAGRAVLAGLDRPGAGTRLMVDQEAADRFAETFKGPRH